jgi:lipopolysaccharide export system ATP-binding protein
MTLLVADCLAKSFGERRVLSAASLRAVPGQVRVLFGRNGIGKSTLMKIAVGLVQPDSGTVRYADRPLLRSTLAALAREGLFYLADDDLFSPAFSVRRQLGFLSARFNGVPVDVAAQRAGVGHVIDQRPYRLSGGERRRAELAAVLVRNPQCLIADEPYRGISPKDAEELSTMFRELAANGCAVIVSGHEVNTLLDVADHITWCTSGTTYEIGTPEQAREHESLRREYLGPRSAP